MFLAAKVLGEQTLNEKAGCKENISATTIETMCRNALELVMLYFAASSNSRV
jgi:hypothetical protein